MNQYVADAMINIAQNSIAWDKIRLGKFTGSGISSLMTDPRTKADKEAGKWSQTADKYIIGKAMEVITGQSNDDAYGRAIDWGNEWEEVALRKVQVAIQSPDHETELKPSFKLFNDFTGCSPDALMYHGELNIKVGVEVKCPFNSVNHYMHSQVVDAQSLYDINEDYYWQVQLNMLTFNRTHWIFASFDPRMPEHRMLHHAVIEFQSERMTDLLERIERADAYRKEIVQKWNSL
jgi:exodeoxyribonuclease (lambda-induced)